MPRRQADDTLEADEFANEGPLAGVETAPVERPYDEARDPAAFGTDRHHGYQGEPGNVVDLDDAAPAAGADEPPSE